MAWLALPAVALATLAPGADDKWNRFRSAHVDLYSRNSDRDSTALVQKLELAHAIFLQIFAASDQPVPPLTVYFFPRDAKVTDYLPEACRQVDSVAACYVRSGSAGVTVLAPFGDVASMPRVALASYTHHLFRELDDRAPRWYRAGVAGIVQNLEFGSSTITVGKPDAAQIRRLREAALVPVAELLAPGEGTKQSYTAFADQSWALLHLVCFGEQRLTPQQFDQWLEFQRQAAPADAAAARAAGERIIGRSYADLDRQLAAYVHGARYGEVNVPRPELTAAMKGERTPVALDDINARLADVAQRLGHAPQFVLSQLPGARGANDPYWLRTQSVLGFDGYTNGRPAPGAGTGR